MERNQAVRDGLAELTGDQRGLLLLLVADPPLTYEAIGRQLGMPVGSIGPTRARYLDKLRATRPSARCWPRSTAYRNREVLAMTHSQWVHVDDDLLAAVKMPPRPYRCQTAYCPRPEQVLRGGRWTRTWSCCR